MIISGKINKETISLINKNFGNNLKSKTSFPKSNINIVNEVDELNKFVKKEGTLQSAIRIGMPIISKQHRDYSGLVVLKYYSRRLFWFQINVEPT